MDREDLFKIDFNLQRVCAIAVAISIWEHPDVNEKVNSFFKEVKYLQSYPPFGRSKFSEELNIWSDAKELVQKYVASINVPVKLLKELKEATEIIGKQIYCWKYHVINVFGLERKYAGKIYWTSYGLIDETRIFNDFWLKDSKFKISTSKSLLDKPLLFTACIYAQEDYIHSHLKKMQKEICTLIVPNEMPKLILTGYNIIKIGLWYYKSKITHREMKMNISDEELFLTCVSQGYHLAVKYIYMSKLKDNHNDNSLLAAAEICIKEFEKFEGPGKSDYQKERFVEIFIFIMNKMSVIHRQNFITKQIKEILKTFLKYQPFQELCVPLLEKIWIDLGENNHEKLLNFIATKSSYFFEKKITSAVLGKIMERVPKELKKKVFICKSNGNGPLRSYFYSENYGSLKIVINDVDLQGSRNEMIKKGEEQFKKFAKGGDIKNLEKFTKRVLFPQERKQFKLNFYKYSFDYLTSGEFDLADELLNWISDSDQDRKILKNQLESKKICSALIRKWRLDLADRFLVWQFDSEEERKTIKNEIGSDEFLRQESIRIWCLKKGANDETSELLLLLEEKKRKCTEFFKWFLISDEKIKEFKADKLIINEHFVESICNNLNFCDSFDFKEFIGFCDLTEQKIHTIRQNISENLFWWIDTYALEKNYFMMVHSFVCWACDNWSDVIHDYVNSPQGALLCVKIFESNYLYNPKPILLFFQQWAWQLDEVYANIFRQLDSLSGDLVSKETLSNIESLLTELQDGKEIKAIDLKRFITRDNYDSDNAFYKCDRGCDDPKSSSDDRFGTDDSESENPWFFD